MDGGQGEETVARGEGGGEAGEGQDTNRVLWIKCRKTRLPIP